jgi:hypothetical protein
MAAQANGQSFQYNKQQQQQQQQQQQMFPIPLYPKQMCSQLGNKKPL